MPALLTNVAVFLPYQANVNPAIDGWVICIESIQVGVWTSLDSIVAKALVDQQVPVSIFTHCSRWYTLGTQFVSTGSII